MPRRPSKRRSIDLGSIQEKHRLVSSSDLQSIAANQAGGLKSCLSTNCLKSQPNSMRRNVSFHQVQIREYERTLGDNPSVRAGPAISLGWRYNEAAKVKLEDYEQMRPPSRTKQEMIMPRQIREAITREAGVTRSEMRSAVKETNIVRRQRIASASSTVPVLDVLERTQRKVKKMFKKNKKKEEALLWDKAYQVAVRKCHSMNDVQQLVKVDSGEVEDSDSSADSTMDADGLAPKAKHEISFSVDSAADDDEEYGYFHGDEEEDASGIVF